MILLLDVLDEVYVCTFLIEYFNKQTLTTLREMN